MRAGSVKSRNFVPVPALALIYEQPATNVPSKTSDQTAGGALPNLL